MEWTGVSRPITHVLLGEKKGPLMRLTRSFYRTMPITTCQMLASKPTQAAQLGGWLAKQLHRYYIEEEMVDKL